MYTAATKKKTYVKSKQTKSGKHGKGGSKLVDSTLGQKESYIKNKIVRLNDALDEDPVDVEFLRKMMISAHGCVTNDLRCKVWPKLLNVDIFNRPRRKRADIELKEFQTNKWWHQVELDVDRSHRRFPHGTRLSRKRVLQQQLMGIIMRVLCRNPHLHYYQGFHDIAVTFLRVVGEDLAFSLLEQLSINHIRDFMDKNMTRTSRMLSLFYAVLSKVDTQLEDFLIRSDVGTIFALSWLITWYGHDINGFDSIARLYDFFLASHPVMPVYVGLVLVLNNRHQVLEQECDMPMVHRCLCRLPSYVEYDEVDAIIKRAYELYTEHPPSTLRYETRKYIRESDSITHHAELLFQSYNQRPDRVLRRRKKHGRLFSDSSSYAVTDEESTSSTEKQVALRQGARTNPVVKVAVWTMTVSMGVMTFLVLNATNYWS